MNEDAVLVSAPGKVIIHGEHAVVYGKKALACSLDVRTYLKLSAASDSKVEVSLPDIDVHGVWELEDLQKELQLPLCDAIRPDAPTADVLDKLKVLSHIPSDCTDTKNLAVIAFLYLFCSIVVDKSTKRLPSAHIELRSALPPGAGLGSSAAFSTCLATSLLKLVKLISSPACTNGKSEGTWQCDDLDLINRWAYQSEKILHGNPSGIDNSVSTYGGGLVFQNKQLTPLKSIPNLQILLVNTEIPRSTKTMVAGVRDKRQKYPAIVEPVLDSIEAISDTSLELLQKQTQESGEPPTEEFQQMMDLVNMNQKHLDFLGVSHPAIDTVCQLAAKYKLAAKLTGAGGGGCVFVLLHGATPSDVVSSLWSELESHGFSVWRTTLGGSGVLSHFSTNSHQYDVPQQLR